MLLSNSARYLNMYVNKIRLKRRLNETRPREEIKIHIITNHSMSLAF